jgi:5'-nucleotidase
MGSETDKYILLTNDDGIRAPGLLKLMEAASPLGKIMTVAPELQQSGSSHALTLDNPLRINWLAEDRASVDGTPTDCILVAMRGMLERRPDLLISGINHGPNLGDDVTYSGTVAAAFEGTLLGLPSIAVSVAAWSDCCFEAAQIFIADLARQVLERGLPEGTLLNVNVPSGSADKIRDVRITKLGKRIYRDDVVRKTDPRGRDYYWIGGKDPIWCRGEETDFEAIDNDMISVTPLQLDLTDYKWMGELRKWNLGFRKR